MFAVVSGTKDSPIAENIYRVALYRPSAEVQRLSKEDGMHAASVSLHGTYFADSWSSLTQPTTVVLRDNQANDLRVLEEPIEVPTDRYQFGHVEFRDLPMSDGSTTKAVFILPPDFDESKVYPVWLKTYAGPHAPSVKNSWNSRLPDHLLANLGIVVITFDPRSASGKGAKSAWLAYRQLGVEETKDLLSVCDWLDSQSWVDSKRIGLSGHSYGGYFTAYAMTHTSRIAAGIAGAPVTDWAHYDTIYTERFMSTPALNPDGYRKSSVIAAASQLTGRLLLLHGLKDDNVHPENTLQLVHTLQQANKQFELMLYPTSRHGIYGSHYNKLLFNFMVDAMGKPEARQP
jgi:dipeptidyl-peptidase-4